MEKSITVYDKDIKIGYLKYGRGLYTFEYFVEYTGESLIGLDKIKQSKSPTLFPIFENLLPESDRRDSLIDSKNFEIDFDALLKIKQTHGSFNFVKTENEYLFETDKNRGGYFSEGILGQNDYPFVFSEKIDINSSIIDSKKQNYSSLSGYQNKIDVSIIEDKIVYDKDNANYLLKPFNEDLSLPKKGGKFPYVSIVEHLNMSFFKNALGFNVPQNGLIKANNQFHYLVKRYDRDNGFKIKQYDFAQLMNVNSTHKYNFTSEQLFEAINKIFENDINEKMKALKFYFASSIIQNNDLHLKNIGVIEKEEGKFELAPLYDVISTRIFGDEKSDLALSLNGKRSKLTLKDFYKLCDIVDISKEDFKKEAASIVNIYIEKMPGYITRTKELLRYDKLEYARKNEYSKMNFVEKLKNTYDSRVQQIKKLYMH